MVANGFVWCCFGIPFCPYWCRLRVPVPAPVWYFPGKFIPLHRQNLTSGMNTEKDYNVEVDANVSYSELAESLAAAFEDGAQAFEEAAIALEKCVSSFEQSIIMKLQGKVITWAYRFNCWPRILRPVCLHYFKKWTKRYNSVVCTLYPPAPGAPLPVEELLLDVA